MKKSSQNCIKQCATSILKTSKKTCKNGKNRKNLLTSVKHHAIIDELTKKAKACGGSAFTAFCAVLKKVKKTLKNLLTNAKSCDIIAKPLSQGSESVFEN